MMKKSNKKGFTLVELIVVIAIMAILAAVLVPTVTSKIKEANSSAAKSDVASVASGIQSDLFSLQANKTNKTVYFAENTDFENIKDADDVASSKLIVATDGSVSKIGDGKSDIIVSVADGVITLSKAGGGDTWTVTIDIETGVVSEPTK